MCCRRLLLALALALPACGTDEPLNPEPRLEICEALTESCEAPIDGNAPALSAPTQVVPSQLMPPEVVSQISHNNLDIVWHEGRLFFAFRTAPHHFAGTKTVLYVLSTTDQQHWRYETEVFMERDLREPRFLSLNGRLYLYFALLGTIPISFDPGGARMIEYLGPGKWTAPEEVFAPGFIPWRARAIDGVGHVVGYTGGENIYQNDGEKISVYWLTTHDGRHFEPAVEGQPVVLTGGSSETDFAFAPDGALIAISRNEAGDELGWGSKICRAEPESLGDWQCVGDKRKYDSPLVFSHAGEVYVIGRRNLTETGNYDLEMRELSPEQQTTTYNADYWRQPKRCSLWHVDQTSLEVSFILDLPSNGDTCFPGLVQLTENRYLVYDYSSDHEGPDLKWLEGQQEPTHIHRMTLEMP